MARTLVELDAERLRLECALRRALVNRQPNVRAAVAKELSRVRGLIRRAQTAAAQREGAK